MTPPLPLAWRLQAAVAAVVIPPLLDVTSFARLMSWIGREPRRLPPRGSVHDASLARWVDRLLAHLPGPWHGTCLKRAAVLYHLLRRAGQPVEVWIGVRRDDVGALAAHAWLVLEGVPYLEGDLGASAIHAVIARFPEGGPRTA